MCWLCVASCSSRQCNNETIADFEHPIQKISHLTLSRGASCCWLCVLSFHTFYHEHYCHTYKCVWSAPRIPRCLFGYEYSGIYVVELTNKYVLPGIQLPGTAPVGDITLNQVSYLSSDAYFKLV